MLGLRINKIGELFVVSLYNYDKLNTKGSINLGSNTDPKNL
jgi:hypothetical protein